QDGGDVRGARVRVRAVGEDALDLDVGVRQVGVRTRVQPGVEDGRVPVHVGLRREEGRAGRTAAAGRTESEDEEGVARDRGVRGEYVLVLPRLAGAENLPLAEGE